MDTQDYMFLMRKADWDQGLSAAEAQAGLAEMMSWVGDLQAQGIVRAGQPLQAKGQVVRSVQGRVVTDGPFIETKEAVGGYLLVRARSFEEAIEVASQCPVLRYGLVIEVRPMAEVCPITSRADEELVAA